MGSFWYKHVEYQRWLRAEDKPRSRGASFGTIAGHQSVAELKDLIAIQDARMKAIKSAFDGSTWFYTDAPAATDWINDWTALSNRYDSAKLKAESLIMATPLGKEFIPAQDEFDGIMRAVEQVANTRTKGDWSDLAERLVRAKIPVDESGVPQPSAPDADLHAYQKTGTIMQEVKNLPNKVLPTADFKKAAIAVGVAAAGLLVLKEIL
jgi:hypothetical protein